MPDKKMIEYKRVYLLNVLGGTNKIFRRWWEFRIALMSEGEVLKRYYELTDKKTEGDDIRNWRPDYEGRN